MSQALSAPRMLQSLQSAASPTTQQMLSVSDPVVQSPQTEVVPSSSDLELTNQQKLAVFESVLDEVAAQPSQPAAPVTVPQGVSKERLEGARPVVATTELPGGMQYVESEPTPELSPEVAEYLQKVQENPVQMPQEIVIAAEQSVRQDQQAPPQSVKVLPITKEIAEAGSKKNPTFSVRWLVEFSHKIAAMFAGKAVYRSE